MEQTYGQTDLSMSPTKILERLQILRQLQLLQRGKLQEHSIQNQDSPEISSNTEVVSHFSTSTSYNTFRSLLQSQHSSNDSTPRFNVWNSSKKDQEKDFIDGVSVLNLSQESEFILNSPTSIQSKLSSKLVTLNKKSPKKQISLDEMPILTPTKEFDTLVVEKLHCEKSGIINKAQNKDNILAINTKRPFLRKGEGMTRFGLQKNDLVIQNTKSLPWRQKKAKEKSTDSSNQKTKVQDMTSKKPDFQILVSTTTPVQNNDKLIQNEIKHCAKLLQNTSKETICPHDSNFNLPMKQSKQNLLELPQEKPPLQINKGKTWATVLTKEQDDFLRQLKQSDYYKNFVSPSKSDASDLSCEGPIKIRQEKEIAEQNMFELLEAKVTHESFNINNSFINRFLKRSNLECSGESTPLIMQKCLSNNPNLMHIYPDIKVKENDNYHDYNTCHSECTECCETCSTVSSCSCNTVEPNDSKINSVDHVHKNQIVNKNIDKIKNQTVTSAKEIKTGIKDKKNKQGVDSNTKDDNDTMKASMTEMNAKLIATSELLKDRLCELEDEIETFRKENANLTKMREEVDLERQKFYEEKAAFEQKFNEEKILSEYYIAEEKEKLSKQKQLYERYVRDMRGRLNKKEKDELINLKKEICDLKEEIRIKDAKSTSTIARLRNQLKIMEKEKKHLQDEIEKLKKENRRIQHSNDVTRRLTNLKYLEQINKKLFNIASKDTQPEIDIDCNTKYKAFEIERQSRSRRKQSQNKKLRPRAKSVPNLNVTSRYAKYFSQKDAISQIESNKTLNLEILDTSPVNYDDIHNHLDNFQDTLSNSENGISDDDDENNLEKIYVERFRNISPPERKTVQSNSSENCNQPTYKSNDSKKNIACNSNLPQSSLSNQYNCKNNSSPNSHKSKTSDSSSILSNEISPTSTSSVLHNSADYNINHAICGNGTQSSQSPISIVNNHSTSFQKFTSMSNLCQDSRMTVTPEPSASKSSLTKTNLNPTEIRKPDGSRELRFPNGNIKYISADAKYSKFTYYNGDVKENFYSEGRIKYFYAETQTYHTTHADGLEVLEFPDGQMEKRYKDGSSEIHLPNGSVRYFDPKNEHVREEWRFPDGATLTIAANGEQRIVFPNGQVEVHTKDHKRREYPDGTVKLVYSDGTSETRYASGRVRIKDKHGNLIMDSAAR